MWCIVCYRQTFDARVLKLESRLGLGVGVDLSTGLVRGHVVCHLDGAFRRSSGGAGDLIRVLVHDGRFDGLATKIQSKLESQSQSVVELVVFGEVTMSYHALAIRSLDHEVVGL